MRFVTKSKSFRWFVVGAIALTTTLLPNRPATAQSKSPGSVVQCIKLNAVGDADCEMELRLPADAYTKLKNDNVNKAVFLRRLGWEHVPAEIESPTATFEDAASIVKVQWRARGYATYRNGKWEAPVAEVARGYLSLNRTNLWERPLPPPGRVDIVRVHDKEILLNEAVSHVQPEDVLNQHPLAKMPSAASALTRVLFPNAVSDVTLEADPKRLVYRLAGSPMASPALTPAEKVCTPKMEIKINVQPRLMANISKSYGTSRASTLWVARVVAKNVGDVPVQDYKVRVRLSNGTNEWTPWQRSDELCPTQTVVDAFHPLLDPHLLAKNQSTQRSYVYIEYSYRDKTGKEYSEQVVRNIELLSRNEVVWSSFTNDQIVGFHDRFNNAPLVLASMTTKDDPVVQIVGGQVSGLAGNINASATDENALRFMQALHRYVVYNGISYQAPPGYLLESNLAQHVKYARDVLRNRAGTCVDLAVLYASVYEAVGLEPILVVVPGHCFPAVRLPQSQKVVAFESTLVTQKATFEQGLEIGAKLYNEAIRTGDAYVINIKTMHNDGIYPLDLETLSDDVLTRWGRKCPPSSMMREETPPAQPVEHTDDPKKPLIKEDKRIGDLQTALEEAQAQINKLQNSPKPLATAQQTQPIPQIQIVNRVPQRVPLGIALATCNDGAHVTAVAPNAPATRCRDLETGVFCALEPGDHVLAVNGTLVSTAEEATFLVNASVGQIRLVIHDGRNNVFRVVDSVLE